MKKRKGFIIYLLFFLCLLGFLYSAWVLLYRQYDLYQSKRSFEDLQEKKEKIDITKPKIPFTYNKEETPSKILPEEKDKALELTEEERTCCHPSLYHFFAGDESGYSGLD